MSKRGLPSLAALLGLVAIAGYQNRDKISDFVKNLGGSDAAGGMLDNVKKSLGVGDGAQAGSAPGGLGELIDHFTKGGQGDAAKSWVGTGPNSPISEGQLESALGPDLLDTLAKQTGLTKDELLARLSKVLPDAVDKMTPDGRVPA